MNARLYFLFAVGFLLLTACERVEKPLPKVEQSKEEVAPAEHTPKKEFLASTRKELDSLQQELDALKEKVAMTSAAEKERIKSEIENFQQQKKDLEIKWDSFREEGSNAWLAFERSFKKSIEDLRNAIRKVNAIRK